MWKMDHLKKTSHLWHHATTFHQIDRTVLGHLKVVTYTLKNLGQGQHLKKKCFFEEQIFLDKLSTSNLADSNRLSKKFKRNRLRQHQDNDEQRWMWSSLFTIILLNFPPFQVKWKTKSIMIGILGFYKKNVWWDMVLLHNFVFIFQVENYLHC